MDEKKREMDECTTNLMSSPSRYPLHRYLNLHVDVFEIKTLRAASYTPTPENFRSPKCGLVNIENGGS